MARNFDGGRDLIEARNLRLAVGRLARRLKQLYDADELTFSESSLLSRLDREGPATPTELAAAEHIRPQAMGNTLTDLEQRGLVARAPDPSDGRRLIVSIRPGGRRLLAAKHEHVNDALRAATATFTAAERRQLAAAVGLLDRLAERL